VRRGSGALFVVLDRTTTRLGCSDQKSEVGGLASSDFWMARWKPNHKFALVDQIGNELSQKLEGFDYVALSF
jgi:hypothetical protein